MKAHARGRVPAEHVIVFDEAQRAYDAAMVAEKHKIPVEAAHSEPEIFVGLGSRIRTHSVTAAFRAGREVPTMARWTRSEASPS